MRAAKHPIVIGSGGSPVGACARPVDHFPESTQLGSRSRKTAWPLPFIRGDRTGSVQLHPQSCCHAAIRVEVLRR